MIATRMEMLVAIGIIAVLATLIIPNVGGMRDSLRYRQMNDYAKEIFMAAQSTLVEKRAEGALPKLQTAADQARVPSSNNANFPATDYSTEYYYTTGGKAFSWLLPPGSIDETLRSQKILIEYNPYTGNVYAVFYSEGDEVLNYRNVYRDSEEDIARRKEIFMGYYSGSGLSSNEARLQKEPTLRLIHDQEAFVELRIPVPEQYASSPSNFSYGLVISVTVTGETPFNEAGEIAPGSTPGNFTLPMTLETGTENGALVYKGLIDSLADTKSFAGMKENNPGGAARAVGNIQDSGKFVILPGDNVIISAQITFNPTGDQEALRFDSLTIGGVNPMFDSMQKVTVAEGETRCYDLYLTNGRQLQNLNAIHPAMADRIRNIYISQDIYWNETVAYYQAKSSGTSAEAECPGRGLPYFVPITNQHLLKAGTSPAAKVLGGKNRVLYLEIDGAKTLSKNYYVDNGASDSPVYTGLFSDVNTTIESLSVVNPKVTGTGNSAVGALAGHTQNAYIFDCGVYMDLDDQYFAGIDSYHVTGSEHVGGLVGYAQNNDSSRATNQTVGTKASASFSQCFAAIPVNGNMTATQSRGAGGFVGRAESTNCYNCYASSQVAVTGANIHRAGGFAGICAGTKFTNCFASGNVFWPAGADRMGAFVGEVNYTGNISGNTTYFSSCYSAGEIKVVQSEQHNGKSAPKNKGRFSGVVNGTTEKLYRDSSYYLNLSQVYGKKNGNNNNASTTDLCAEVVGYDSLTILPIYQLSEKRDGFSDERWESATAATTHSYSYSGAVYPFSKLTQMDYYGDWVGFTPSAGMAYYEEYPNGDIAYYIQGSDVSTDKKYTLSEREVVGDGYAFVIQSTEDAALTKSVEMKVRLLNQFQQ